jgi:hypothetical protein
MFTCIYKNYWNAKETLTKELKYADRFDLSGMYFEHIKIEGFTVNKQKVVLYNCKCICGNKVKIKRDYLTSSRFCGHCGCMTNINRKKKLAEVRSRKKR